MNDRTALRTFSRRENMSSIVLVKLHSIVLDMKMTIQVCQPPPYTVSQGLIILVALLTTVSVIYGTGLQALGEPPFGVDGVSRGKPEKCLRPSRTVFLR